eukprot:365226-Chlamydomonas_euryale.AAC.7
MLRDTAAAVGAGAAAAQAMAMAVEAVASSRECGKESSTGSGVGICTSSGVGICTSSSESPGSQLGDGNGFGIQNAQGMGVMTGIARVTTRRQDVGPTYSSPAAVCARCRAVQVTKASSGGTPHIQATWSPPYTSVPEGLAPVPSRVEHGCRWSLSLCTCVGGERYGGRGRGEAGEGARCILLAREDRGRAAGAFSSVCLSSTPAELSNIPSIVTKHSVWHGSLLDSLLLGSPQLLDLLVPAQRRARARRVCCRPVAVQRRKPRRSGGGRGARNLLRRQHAAAATAAASGGGLAAAHSRPPASL